MNQIPNIEEEYRYYQAPNVPIAKVFAQTNDGTRYELKEVLLHQQLQKAREGLKARIELLLENNTARDNMDFSHGYRNALLDIESYLSELDQDKV